MHQASYPFPSGNLTDTNFTGEIRIYEAIRDSELIYWCELKRGAEK